MISFHFILGYFSDSGGAAAAVHISNATALEISIKVLDADYLN